MKRILVPVDGSPRSLIALEQLKTTFSPKVFEVVLVMVRENTGYALSLGEEAEIREELDKKLNSIAKTIDKYSVITRSAIGRAGARVIEAAKEFGVEMIVMTKSTKPGAGSTIGLTASYIIRHAQCDVMIVKETDSKKIEGYRGAIYKRAKGTVALRGQFSLKQSECLIPSVKGDVIYHIDVKRGRVRFLHRSFNAMTKEWDLPPSNGQQEIYEIEAGESVQIPVNATGAGKMADRIRILNRSMKTEAVFVYEITADNSAFDPEAKPESSEAEAEAESEVAPTVPTTSVVATEAPVEEPSVSEEIKTEVKTKVTESATELTTDFDTDVLTEEISATPEATTEATTEKIDAEAPSALPEETVPDESKNTIAAIEELCATGAIDAVELIKALDELEAKSESVVESDTELKNGSEDRDK